MSKTGKIVLWVIVLILIVWGIVVMNKKGPAEDALTIKIGFVGPLTGDLANMGENAQAAVGIAVEEINKAGGILGKQIEVVYEDDACTGATGANAVSKLINTDKVVAILGSACSGATLGEAPISEAAKVPQLSFCSTNPTISQAGDYIFRDVPSDLFQAKYAAEYLVKNNKTKVALLTTKNDWGDGLNKAFTEAFAKAGGTIVMTSSFNPDAKDFRTELVKIKAANPDAVYFAGYTDGTITALKQSQELGMTAQFFGADAWDDTKIWSELGTLGNGAMYTVVGTNSSDAFKAKMKAKLGKDDLVYCSNYAYDGVKILAEAMNRANSSNSTAIKDALYKTSYTGGVGSKELSFDVNGDPTSAAYIIKIAKDGKATEMVQ
ncbi:MAG TPA: ABC transporter substrate-binding protein [Candidatus Paceibacterota bacterium]